MSESIQETTPVDSGLTDLSRFRDVVLQTCELAEQDSDAACAQWRQIIDDGSWYQIAPLDEYFDVWNEIWYHYGLSAYGAYPDSPEFARSIFDAYQISAQDVRERLARSGADPISVRQALGEIFPETADQAGSVDDEGDGDVAEFDESEFTDEELGDE
jgi:hypothetical protein